MLGGRGRGPLGVPVDLDALLIDDSASRQVTPTAMRRSASDLSRFVEAPLASSPVALGTPQTIPAGGAPPINLSSVPTIQPPGVTIGR